MRAAYHRRGEEIGLWTMLLSLTLALWASPQAPGVGLPAFTRVEGPNDCRAVDDTFASLYGQTFGGPFFDSSSGTDFDPHQAWMSADVQVFDLVTGEFDWAKMIGQQPAEWPGPIVNDPFWTFDYNKPLVIAEERQYDGGKRLKAAFSVPGDMRITFDNANARRANIESNPAAEASTQYVANAAGHWEHDLVARHEFTYFVGNPGVFSPKPAKVTLHSAYKLVAKGVDVQFVIDVDSDGAPNVPPGPNTFANADTSGTACGGYELGGNYIPVVKADVDALITEGFWSASLILDELTPAGDSNPADAKYEGTMKQRIGLPNKAAVDGNL
jgi:hypothetical protein